MGQRASHSEASTAACHSALLHCAQLHQLHHCVWMRPPPILVAPPPSGQDHRMAHGDYRPLPLTVRLPDSNYDSFYDGVWDLAGEEPVRLQPGMEASLDSSLTLSYGEPPMSQSILSDASTTPKPDVPWLALPPPPPPPQADWGSLGRGRDRRRRRSAVPERGDGCVRGERSLSEARCGSGGSLGRLRTALLRQLERREAAFAAEAQRLAAEVEASGQREAALWAQAHRLQVDKASEEAAVQRAQGEVLSLRRRVAEAERALQASRATRRPGGAKSRSASLCETCYWLEKTQRELSALSDSTQRLHSQPPLSGQAKPPRPSPEPGHRGRLSFRPRSHSFSLSLAMRPCSQ